MPKLNSLSSKLEKVDLPSYPADDPAWVVVATGELTVGDVVDVSEDDTEVKASIASVTARIQEWNLEGEDGSILPITMENVAKLRYEDFGAISRVIFRSSEALTDAEKKALSSTSSPSETESNAGQTINVEVA